MPEFMKPFVGKLPEGKLSDRELARALRLSLAAEEEAIHQYGSVAVAPDIKQAKAVLQAIANEEKEHTGEFIRLMSFMLPQEQS